MKTDEKEPLAIFEPRWGLLSTFPTKTADFRKLPPGEK